MTLVKYVDVSNILPIHSRFRLTSYKFRFSPSQEDGDDDPADDDAGNAASHARPQTRKELDDIKTKYSNKLLMAFHYHQDPMLPLEFKAMYWASKPLLKEYEQNLDVQKDGQDC